LAIVWLQAFIEAFASFSLTVVNITLEKPTRNPLSEAGSPAAERFTGHKTQRQAANEKEIANANLLHRAPARSANGSSDILRAMGCGFEFLI
jgi:hypothetical protein